MRRVIQWLWLSALLVVPAAVTAQDVCYVQQQLCNEACAGDTLCRVRTCFKEAVECQKRLDSQSNVSTAVERKTSQEAEQEGAQAVVEEAVEPEREVLSPAVVAPRRTPLPKPKTFVLPPVETCASLSWEGDRLVEFTATNNCPAAIDADVLFSDGTRVAVYCDGYETCTASFPKVAVSDRFQYWIRYATDK